MRYAFINTLIKEARRNKRIMLLTGDLGFTVFESFRDQLPDQFVNMGVAEQNMMGVATGLALTGHIVFAYSIATFATMRPFEQIRNDIASHNASVVVVGTGAGLSYAHASITHHAVEDIALLRTIPNMTILCPADPLEASWAVKTAIRLKKPVYLRLGMKGEPNLYKKPPALILGKGSVLRRGKHVALIATGNIIANSLAAADLLKTKNISVTVVSMHTIKPFDAILIKRLAATHKLLVSIEEHTVSGGLGSAVSEVLSEQTSRSRLLRIGIPDRFIFEKGNHHYLRKLLRLDPHGITIQVRNALS